MIKKFKEYNVKILLNNVIEYIQYNILKYPQDARKISIITKNIRKENECLNKELYPHYNKELADQIKKEKKSNKIRKLAEKIIKRKIFPKILKYSKLGNFSVDIFPEDFKIFTFIIPKYSLSFYYMNLLHDEIGKILKDNGYDIKYPPIRTFTLNISWKY